MNIGYMRVSTADQDLSLQRDALTKAGCGKIYEDVISGSATERPGLAAALEFAREGDVIVVWKLDRLGRSLPHLVDVIGQLEARKVGFRSLTETIDTTTSGGKLIFHIFGALGQFERDLIRERTRAGLEAAKAQGRTGGRRKIMTEDKLKKARCLLGKDLSVREVAARLKISKSSLYTALELNKGQDAAE
jgi:DNA invertase Pin-like site-specific DNA recombinase